MRDSPAFPEYCSGHLSFTEGHPTRLIHHGLTKREWMAGMAMQGIVGNSVLQGAFAQAEPDVEKAIPGMAKMAFLIADAMLAESDKNEK